jgi:hypothetical protein
MNKVMALAPQGLQTLSVPICCDLCRVELFTDPLNNGVVTAPGLWNKIKYFFHFRNQIILRNVVTRTVSNFRPIPDGKGVQ